MELDFMVMPRSCSSFLPRANTHNHTHFHMCMDGAVRTWATPRNLVSYMTNVCEELHQKQVETAT